MYTTDAQNEIITLLNKNNIPEARLAEYMDISPQSFHYLIHHSAKLDITDYNTIKNFFHKNEIYMNDPIDNSIKTRNLITEFTALSAHLLDVFNTAIDVRKLNELEKKEAERKIENMREEIDSKLDGMLELIKGKTRRH